jgi:hypothetical protein
MHGDAKECKWNIGAKSEGKGSVGKPSYRKDKNIKMDAREIWWGVINSISLVHEKDHWRIVKVVPRQPGPLWFDYSLLVTTNSVALVRELTIPTERPSLVDEASANFCGYRDVAWSVRQIPYGRNLGFLDRTSLEHSTKHFSRTLNKALL